MRSAGRRVAESAGIVDAGVILTRLDGTRAAILKARGFPVSLY